MGAQTPLIEYRQGKFGDWSIHFVAANGWTVAILRNFVTLQAAKSTVKSLSAILPVALAKEVPNARSEIGRSAKSPLDAEQANVERGTGDGGAAG